MMVFVTEDQGADAEDTGGEDTPLRRRISVEFLGNPKFLNPLRNLPAGLLGDSAEVRKWQANQAVVSMVLRKMAEEERERQEQLARLSESIAETRFAPERQRIEREVRALELQGQIADTQRAMLELQIRQGADARQDRRIQYAVLVIAVLGISATIVATVAVASGSVWWSAFAGLTTTIALALLALLVMSERRPNPSPE